MSVLDFVQDTSSLPVVYRTLSTEALHKLATAERQTLGNKAYVLGHHYQKDEVIRYADNPHLDIVSLNPFMCPCLTMNRINFPQRSKNS